MLPPYLVLLLLLFSLSACENSGQLEGEILLLSQGNQNSNIPPDDENNPPPENFVIAKQHNEFGGGGGFVDSNFQSDFALFQDSTTSVSVNRDGGGVKRNGVRDPYSFGVYMDPFQDNKYKYIVGDRGNNRLLIFNQKPLSSSSEPDVVVGQLNFNSGDPNAGFNQVSNLGFNQIVHASVCGNGNLFVADRLNNRVLGYRRIPLTNGARADFVIGQPDFVSSISGGGAQKLFNPYAVYCIRNKLFVVDKENHRIVVYDPVPTDSFPTAKFVIGQSDTDTVTPGCADNKLRTPNDIAFRGGLFFIVDSGNNRVLVFNGLPVSSNASAAYVLGQPNFTTCSSNQGAGTPSAQTLNAPNGMTTNNNYIAVSDGGNARILFYRFPIDTNQAASAVFGQPDFVTNRVWTPEDLSTSNVSRSLLFDNGYLWIGNIGANRIQISKLPF